VKLVEQSLVWGMLEVHWSDPEFLTLPQDQPLPHAGDNMHEEAKEEDKVANPPQTFAVIRYLSLVDDHS
jgi:hypothetical protein